MKTYLLIGIVLENQLEELMNNKLGINIVGYIKQTMGLSHNPRQIYKSLIDTDIDVKQFEFTLDKKTQIAGNTNDVNIICMNPDVLNDLRQLESRGFKCKGKTNIALWAWETDVLPEKWVSVGKQFDEIWTVSEYSKNTIQTYYPNKPIHVINIMGEEIKPLDKHECRNICGLTDDLFSCLYIFDFNSDYYRKNPIGAVKAFKQAFKQDEKVFLIIKAKNGSKHVNHLANLHREIGSDFRISVIDNELSNKKLSELYNLSDLYISLHRSEGSGLTIMEMLMLGKPVVCTNYSGNLDFCKEYFTNLVDYKLVRVNQDSVYYKLLDGSESYWAEPDINDAAIKIKSVYDNYQNELEKMPLAKQYIEDNYNSIKLYNFVKDRVNNYIK